MPGWAVREQLCHVTTVGAAVAAHTRLLPISSGPRGSPRFTNERTHRTPARHITASADALPRAAPCCCQVALLRNYSNGLTALVASLKSAASLKPDRPQQARGGAWHHTQVRGTTAAP
jgi:hypothetical protein